MRFFKSVFMLLTLVTFSTGFGKTTTDLTKNSKTECVAFDIVKDPADSSVYVATFVSVDLVYNHSTKDFFVKPISFVQSLYDNPDLFIKDVGWFSDNKRNAFSKIPSILFCKTNTHYAATLKPKWPKEKHFYLNYERS